MKLLKIHVKNVSGKYTIYFDIERPWTLKFNQVYTQLFSDYDLHKTLGSLFLYLSHRADFKFTRQLFKTKLNIE
jgi:hypothetical protein